MQAEPDELPQPVPSAGFHASHEDIFPPGRPHPLQTLPHGASSRQRRDGPLVHPPRRADHLRGARSLHKAATERQREQLGQARQTHCVRRTACCQAPSQSALFDTRLHKNTKKESTPQVTQKRFPNVSSRIKHAFCLDYDVPRPRPGPARHPNMAQRAARGGRQ